MQLDGEGDSDLFCFFTATALCVKSCLGYRSEAVVFPTDPLLRKCRWWILVAGLGMAESSIATVVVFIFE